MGAQATQALTRPILESDDPGSESSAHGWGRVGATAIILFAAFMNLLLPIERGFPYLTIGPISLFPPVWFNLVAFGALLVTRPVRTLRRFKHPPLFWQGVLTLFLIGRGIFSPEASKAIATAIMYAGTWVAQFMLFLTLLNWIGRAAFARAYVAVAGVAAVLGVLEGLFGIVLPPYQAFRFIQAVVKGYGEVGGGRVDGPPGNSILFAFMMALSVPFAFEVRSRLVRWGLVSLFVLAILLSVARVGFLMLLIFGLGGLLLGGKGARAAKIGLGIAAAVAVIFATIFSSNPTVERITSRLSGGGDATGNIQFRAAAIRVSVERTILDGQIDIAVWGAGIRSGDNIGEQLAEGVTTLDNAYATLFYEGGLLVLGMYTAAHAFHIRRLWSGYGPARLYWFGGIAGLAGGMAFASVYTIGANFPFVATLAVLGHERIVRKPRRGGAGPALAPTPDAPA